MHREVASSPVAGVCSAAGHRERQERIMSNDKYTQLLRSVEDALWQLRNGYPAGAQAALAAAVERDHLSHSDRHQRVPLMAGSAKR